MNYYNYFTEIEEHFQRKRGAQVLVSPVDWALIASWREAGIPLAAVLAGIDQAFEKFDSGRRRDTQRHRSLLYCATAVLQAAEAMQAAAVGAADLRPAPLPPAHEDAFSRERIAAFLAAAVSQIAACPQLQASPPALAEIVATLRRLIESLQTPGAAATPQIKLEDLDRVLTVLDDKIQMLLLQAVSVDGMVQIRAELARELTPYRRKLRADQLALIERQFLQRRLLEHARLPRLSLFYMPG